MTTRARIVALRLAVELHKGFFHPDYNDDDGRVLRSARHFEHWLDRPGPPATLTFLFGPVLDQETGQPTGRTIPEGATRMQLHDDEQVTLGFKATDKKGFETTDANLSWSIDNESIATLTVADDTLSATLVAGSPGTGALVTMTDPNGRTVTLSVDVVPGDADTLEFVVGDVTKQA